jgi:hypothetical protein
MNEQLDALRRRIEHEDNLVNQRLSWLVGSQAFLLTAFAISLNTVPDLKPAQYASANRTLVALLPYTGVACILILWLTLVGALWSMAVLRAQAGKITQPGDFPIHSRATIRWMGFAAPIAIPAVFLALWLTLIAGR